MFVFCLRVITSFAVPRVGRGKMKCYELDPNTHRAELAQQVQWLFYRTDYLRFSSVSSRIFELLLPFRAQAASGTLRVFVPTARSSEVNSTRHESWQRTLVQSRVCSLHPTRISRQNFPPILYTSWFLFKRFKVRALAVALPGLLRGISRFYSLINGKHQHNT
jgi:hypothetical protein